MRKPQDPPNGTRSTSLRACYFQFAALVFAIGAIVHGVSLLRADHALFHAAFVVVDIVTSWLLLRRPPWLRYAFLLLAAEQVVAHGIQFLAAARDGRLDFVSLFIIVFVQLTAALLFADGNTSPGRHRVSDLP